MQFNGFPTISAYERECARVGFATDRQTYHKDGEDYLLLITRTDPPSSTGVEAWHLFTADETREVLSGIIQQGGPSAAAQLAQSGFFSESLSATDGEEQKVTLRLLEAGGFHSEEERQHIQLHDPAKYAMLVREFTGDSDAAPAPQELFTEDTGGDWQQFSLFA